MTRDEFHDKWLVKQIGVKESPPNSNQVRYATFARIPGQPWCGGFVSNGCSIAGIGMEDGDPYDDFFFVYTPTGAQIFKNKGLFFTDITKARLGDVLFYANSSRICHTGFFEKLVSPTQWDAIEGNTSSGVAGSQSDGGGVFRRRRSSVPGFTLAGIGRLPFTTENHKDITPVFTFPKRDWLQKGDDGDDVRLLQQDLNLYFRLAAKPKPIHIKVDAEFGKDTRDALMQFQHERHLDVTGFAGDKTIDVLETVIKRRKARSN
jgi:hypothetical protein